MKQRKAAELFPAGDFIREEPEARGWAPRDLAKVIGRPRSVVNQLIAGKRGITPEAALSLSAAFGTSAEYWLNLQTIYVLAHAETDVQAIRRRARSLSLLRMKKP